MEYVLDTKEESKPFIAILREFWIGCQRELVNT